MLKVSLDVFFLIFEYSCKMYIPLHNIYNYKKVVLILKMHLEIALALTNKISGCKMCIIRCTPSLLKT